MRVSYETVLFIRPPELRRVIPDSLFFEIDPFAADHCIRF